MQILSFRSISPKIVDLDADYIVYPNELQRLFVIVLRVLWSGIVFALFFASSMFFYHRCHWSLIHMRCALIRSILLMGCCCNQ